MGPVGSRTSRHPSQQCRRRLHGAGGDFGAGGVAADHVDQRRRRLSRHQELHEFTGGNRARDPDSARASSILARSWGWLATREASAYNAGKGAVRLFTKAVAIEFAQKRTPIRVNSIHPGFVKTPLLASGMQKWVDRGLAAQVQDLIDALAAATPNGRLAEPAEIRRRRIFSCLGRQQLLHGFGIGHRRRLDRPIEKTKDPCNSTIPSS